MKLIKFKHPFVFDKTYEKEMFFWKNRWPPWVINSVLGKIRWKAEVGGRVNKKASDSPKGCSAVRTFSHSSCRILRRSANSVSETNPELMIVWLDTARTNPLTVVSLGGPTRFALGHKGNRSRRLFKFISVHRGKTTIIIYAIHRDIIVLIFLTIYYYVTTYIEKINDSNITE